MADSFHELGPIHRKNIAENFATWFTQETKEGNDADNNAPAWMANVFYAKENGGWEDVERAVGAVMDDPRFDPIISDPELLKETFDWFGTNYQEDAANEFFLRSYDMFKLTQTALGHRGIEQLSFMKSGKYTKIGEIDSWEDGTSMQSDYDLLDSLRRGGSK